MSAKRTAIIFCFEQPASAVGRLAADAARLLAARGHPVFLFTRLPINVDAPGVTVQTIGDSDDPDLIGQVRTFTLRASTACNMAVPRDSAEIVLIGMEWSSIPTLQILSALRKAPVLLCLCTLERQRSDMSSAVSKTIEQLETEGLQLAQSVLALGANTVEAARRLIPDFAQKVSMIATPFAAEHFRKDLDAGAVKARYQIGPVDPMILCVGTLDEDHGADLLIKAAPAILKKQRQARFVFVGDGPLFWTLRIYARYLNLDHAVRIVGHLEGETLNELVQASDIVIVPSRKATEQWPILAGWAAGKAVVASHEGAGGLVEHEQNGVLIYPLADSCAWGVDRIFNDPYLWGRIRENGQAKLSSEFGEKALGDQLEKAVSGISGERAEEKSAEPKPRT
ncbi:MAG TPA: glycosyltransferase family 4 protein [Planctomycetota bacterium]|nr:glycosyltransferase family 4 protein [Planctomycetota bacterium]